MILLSESLECRDYTFMESHLVLLFKNQHFIYLNKAVRALPIVERMCVPSCEGLNGGLLVEFLECGT